MQTQLITRSIFAISLLFMQFSHQANAELDEIVVTADFRERPATAIPSSVTVMDADFIEDVAVQHFEELVALVPNLNWSGDGHRARYFQIRGVGELEQYQGAPNPSIGFLIDDIDFSGIGTIATLFDVESVEILRGSQGSRYGANALGGLIYVRSAAPGVDTDARIEASIADDNALALGIAYGGAFDQAQNVSFRVSAQTARSDGFRSNAYLDRDDTNNRDETVLRARLSAAIADDLSLKAAVLWANVDNGYDAFALDNSYNVLSDKPGKDAQESIGASVRLDWDMREGLSLVSLTSIADSDIEFGFDADWGNEQSWDPVTYDYVSSSDRSRTTASQEFRFATDEVLIGLYVQNLKEELASLNTGDYYDPFYDFADSLDYAFASEYEATNIALFASLDHELSSATRLSSGLRVEHRSTDYSDSDQLAAGPSETLWGGELGLSYSLSEQRTAYVALSKGYKAGGFNLGLVPDGRREFAAEALWTLEAGTKMEFPADNVFLNLSVFHSRRVDQQVRGSVQLDPGDPASFVFFTDNVGDGDTSGLEADLRWYPTDSIEVYANLGLLDAALANGRSQAHAPRYTFASGVAYHRDNGFFFRADVSAKDAFYFDVSHDQRSQAYELLNMRVGFETDGWRTSLWLRNAFDEQYAVRGFYFGNEPPDFPDTLYTRLGDPRQFGITIEKRF